MILDLVYYPDPRLNQSTQKIDEIDDEIRELAENMLETMYFKEGVGLAGPQVGVLKRICVVDASPERDNPLVLINPVITYREGSIESEEGCLSIPGVYGKVERAETITVEYTDLDGNPQVLEKESSFLSIVCQHEIDHLDGILFIQLMSPSEKIKIKKELKQLKEDFKKKKVP